MAVFVRFWGVFARIYFGLGWKERAPQPPRYLQFTVVPHWRIKRGVSAVSWRFVPFRNSPFPGRFFIGSRDRILGQGALAVYLTCLRLACTIKFGFCMGKYTKSVRQILQAKRVGQLRRLVVFWKVGISWRRGMSPHRTGTFTAYLTWAGRSTHFRLAFNFCDDR